jgi:phosphate transport system substrate-binding protein
VLAKKSKFLIGIIGILAAVLVFVVAGCGNTGTKTEKGDAGSGTASEKQVTLNGSGSTFDEPLFSTMFDEYSKIHPNVRVNYQGVGSGTGIKQLSDLITDFGATDAPMKDEQKAEAKGGEVLHIPVTLGAVAIAYNIPNAPKEIKIAPDVLVDIFQGKIKNWNDPRIAADNPGVKFQDLAINIAHRSDGSGTTAIVTDYFSSVSSEWANKIGKGSTVNWPTGVGGKGNPGVAAAIQQTPGTIGYVELAYAKQNDIPYAQMKNKAGKWVSPSLEGASAAAAGAEIPDDMCVSIVNAEGDGAYPISAFSWVILYQDQKDKDKGKAVVELLKWMVHDGQDYSEDLDYAKLPDSLVERIDKMLETVTY